MELTIRRIAAQCKWCQEVDVTALTEVIPVTAVQAAADLARRPGQRERKLTLELTVWLIISLHLFPRVAIPSVLRKLTQGLRLVWPGLNDTRSLLAGASALVYRRTQVGARPLVALFHAVCQPLATPDQLPDAFAFGGLRVVALDGTIENLVDTPANERVFGRRASQRGRHAYPQVLGVCLVECATHAIFEAGFWPATTSEHRVAPRLLRALTPEMVVLWDRGFHSVALLKAVQARHAHAISRLPAHVKPQVHQVLADGSALVYLRPSDATRADPAARLLVRLVRYRLAPATAQAKQGPVYRLVTTLLDPQQASAEAIARLYHRRWAIEETFDELDTHQRLATRTLRSQTPVGVVQELYGLLLAHYAVRTTMYHAALLSQQAPDRLSFVTALQLVCEAIPDFQLLAAPTWATRRAMLLTDIAQARLPQRQVRFNPRVVKRRASKFPQKPPGQHAAPRQRGLTVQPLELFPMEALI